MSSRRYVRNEALRNRKEQDAKGALKALNIKPDFEELNSILGDFASLLPAVRSYKCVTVFQSLTFFCNAVVNAGHTREHRRLEKRTAP